MISLAAVNTMTSEQFVTTFGDVAEHSPWVAEQAFKQAPFSSRDHLVASFEAALNAADAAAQLALIRAHPDLATKARLTADSTNEQKGAGLDTLSSSEFAHFTSLNDAYKSKFGFPFIFAVKGATKQQILESFEARVGNTREQEFAMALTQVMRIFRFRLEDRVSP